jgi:quinoprotein glucose dehydrogenase
MKNFRFSLVFLTCSLMTNQVSAQNVDWPSYGGDNGSNKYSALNQINSDNVSQLVTAWEWDSPDNTLVADIMQSSGPMLRPGPFKSTPIVVNGIMYLPTTYGQIISLDPASGETYWVFDTKTYQDGRPTNLGFNVRGVAYWEDSRKTRIFFATNNSYLWSIDSNSGLPDPEFGENGRVDLTLGLGREVDRSQYGVVSPPLVSNNKVIVNSIVIDGPRNKEAPPGHVRAFNPHTGEIEWKFNTIPQVGEFGNDTWLDGSWEYSGNTNAWTIMSADDELGIVYLPIGTPTNDWYGGLRKGDNLFAESLVAVDVKNGELLWHFQMVHHGVWDYDLPAAPTLIDITVDDRSIKAVAQISKQGFTYVFDRITGAPVWPIEERAVPQSTVPGEQLSLTQPFPTKPAAFEPQGINDDTLIDFTPQLREEALQNIERFDYGPLFTPPSLRGAIQFPGWAGGGEWHGAAFDPQSGLYYVPSASGPIVVQLTEADPSESNLIYRRGGARSVSGPQGLPLTKPPYGRITAINMNTGEHEWVIPHGEGIRQEIISKGIIDPGPVGSTHRVGPVLTESLLFFAQIDGDRNLLRAFDKATGLVIYEHELPLAPQGTPMTYMVDGKQFIVIAVGGRQDARLVALSLPL